MTRTGSPPTVLQVERPTACGTHGSSTLFLLCRHLPQTGAARVYLIVSEKSGSKGCASGRPIYQSGLFDSAPSHSEGLNIAGYSFRPLPVRLSHNMPK